MTELRKTFITDETSGDTMTVNSEGRGDVIQHAHVSQGTQHFHIDGLTTGTYRYILIDISDTTNYPHTLTDYVHVEWLEIEVDADVQGAYSVNLGFLDNVDATNGDRYITKHWSGSRTAGNQLLEFINPYPNGWRMRPENTVTHMISLNDTNYQTDVDLPSTLTPTAPDTPAGTGDVVLEVTVTAGTINLSQEMGYHTH